MERKRNSEDEFIEILTSVYKILELPAESHIELDLGCGKGSFTSALAKKYKNRTILAADIMIGRLRKLSKRNKRMGIENMRLLRAEAKYLISKLLPDSSLNRIHILCPDPWPKERHKHNRLITSEFAGSIHRALKKNGVFHFATDDTLYFETATKIITESNLFTRNDSLISDISNIKTDFEIRWNEMGLKVHHTSWSRKEL